MSFGRAWVALLEGKKVRRKGWGGYWAYEGDTIMMHCKDGRVLDIRKTTDVKFTFDNVACEDWEIVE